jgi:hypothetical protein
MEFSVNGFPNLKIYYKFKKLTNSQKEFINNLIQSTVRNVCSIFEFPPTLDKDFLYNSVLFSLSLQANGKFIIIVKNYDKIFEILKNFSNLSSICKQYNPKFQSLKIIPFFERKLLCINDKLLEASSSLDFDSYCINATASWIPNQDHNKCAYFKVKYFQIFK